MTIAICVLAYLAVGVVVARQHQLYERRRWPSLPCSDPGDFVFYGFVALNWPGFVVVHAIGYLATWRPKREGER